MQQFQIQLTNGPPNPYPYANNGRGSVSGPSASSSNPGSASGVGYQYYGGTSGVRASVACDACRKRKVKCTVVAPHQQQSMGIAPPGSGYGAGGQFEPPARICVRCARLGIDCSWKDEKKGGKVPKGNSSGSSTPMSKSAAHAHAQGLEVVFESYGGCVFPPSTTTLTSFVTDLCCSILSLVCGHEIY